MKLAKKSNFSGIKVSREQDKEKVQYQYRKDLDSDVNQLVLALQGRIRFGTSSNAARGENLSGQWATVSDSGTKDTEFSITHNMGVVPTDYLVTSISKGGVVYKSSTAWTTTTAYFKCSTDNTAITLFILK